jgi:hypothetical protein
MFLSENTIWMFLNDWLCIVQVQILLLVGVTFTYLLVGAAIFDALEETDNENDFEWLFY